MTCSAPTCLAPSIRRPLFDLGARRTDPASGLETWEAITVQPASHGDASHIEAETLRDVFSKFSTSVGLKGSYGAFSGEIDAAFDTSRSVRTTTRFIEYNYQVYRWKLTLPTAPHLAARLTADARADILGDGGAAMAPCSLTPLAVLIDDAARREAIEAAVERATAAHPAPDSPCLAPVNWFNCPTKKDGKTLSRWFYGADPAEAPPSGFGPSEGVPFFAFTRPVEGSIPIYRMSAANPARYRPTPDPTPRNKWAHPVVAFHAFRSDSGRGDRAAVSGFTSDDFPAIAGWRRRVATKVGRSAREEPAAFFAPKV